MAKPELSILIPSVLSRRSFFLQRLLDQLESQIDGQSVEVLTLLETKGRGFGAARNNLMDIARGSYLTWIDDDDRISATYVRDILGAIRDANETDVIVYDMLRDMDGQRQLYRYGLDFDFNNAFPPNVWTGKPSWMHVWRADLARKHRFPEVPSGMEVGQTDRIWWESICKEARTQIRIRKILYYSDLRHAYSECRTPLRRYKRPVYRVLRFLMQKLGV